MKTLHSNLVIFQHFIADIRQDLTQLYIPIWLYSNRIRECKRSKQGRFTFQSGYIPTESGQIWGGKTLLYIPIWLYSNKPFYCSCHSAQISLHSNLVIFQPSHYNTTYLQTLKAAFCRPSFFNPSYRNIFCELFLLSLFRPLLQ